MKLSLTLAFIAALLFASQAQAQPPGPDETGMVPGDVVFGNTLNFPGHAGIYIGKWERLPEEVRTRHAMTLEEAHHIRFRRQRLLESYLVVDSYGGVRIRSFAEMFTEYCPSKGAYRPAGALEWESGDGGAFVYLPDDDERRWKIVEEALTMAAHKVDYDGTKMQEAWRDPKKLNEPYTTMKVDCISMVYVAYWRGAGIELSNWLERKTWAIPMVKIRLAEALGASQHHVDLQEVYREAALLDVWHGKVTTERAGKKREQDLRFDVAIEEVTEDVRHFGLLVIDPATQMLVSVPWVRGFARVDTDGHITILEELGSEVRTLEFLPRSDELELTIHRGEGNDRETVRARLKRGEPVPEGPTLEVTVAWRNQAWRSGPVHAVAAVKPPGMAMVMKEPYLVAVKVGTQTQYAYPGNAVFPDAPKKMGRSQGALFDEVHFRGLSSPVKADEMEVHVVSSDGTRQVSKVAIPFQAESEPVFAASARDRVAKAQSDLETAEALPRDDRRRDRSILHACGRILRDTLDRELASKTWRRAADLIQTSGGKLSIAGLQEAQLKGAWLRGDLSLYRTLVTERERAGTVKAAEYLDLMRMLIAYANDVEAVHTLWPRFAEAVSRVPEAERKRRGWGRLAAQGPLLPKARIRLDR